MRIEKLKLKKLINTRDLGGFEAEGGKKIRRGMLIRSGRPYNLPKKTVDALLAMGLRVIIDMRTEMEIREYPCSVPEGVKHYHLPVLFTATTGITHEKSSYRVVKQEAKLLKREFGSAEEYMIYLYRKILYSEESKQSLKEFFRILLEEDGCILWHCNAGKDRAGIAAFLIEGLLGVSEKDIIADYVASQKFQRKKRFWQKAGLYTVPIVPIKLRNILIALMDAKKIFIISALDEIKKRNGGIKEYCVQELGLDENQINTLKNKYLV